MIPCKHCRSYAINLNKSGRDDSEPDVCDVCYWRLKAVGLQADFDRLHTPRPFDDWHEDIGNVLWWSFPISEPPFSGTPHDDDYPFDFDDHSVGWVPLPDCDKIQEQWETAEKARKT